MKLMRLHLIFAIFLYPNVVIAGPSFDCSKASTNIEKTICKYPVLANLDSEMASKYKIFREQLNEENKLVAKTLQRNWLKQRNKLCNDPSLHNTYFCIEPIYENWLKWMEGGILKVSIPISEGSPTKHLFEPDISFSMAVGRSEESPPNVEQLENGIGFFSSNTYINYNGVNTLIFDGHITYHYDRKYYYEAERANKIWYFMNKWGEVFTALEKSDADLGPQCVSEESKSFLFLDFEMKPNIFGELEFEDQSFTCFTWSNSFAKIRSSKGNLQFFFPDLSSSPILEFSNGKILTVDFDNKQINSSDFFTDNITNYFGIPYSELIDNVTNNELFNRDLKVSKDYCSLPQSSIGWYNSLTAAMVQEGMHLNFKQIAFIALNVITEDDLKAAMDFKPIIIDVLKYLDGIKSVPNWEKKLVKATKPYSANYYGDKGKLKSREYDPFIEAGFPTNDCYRGQWSSFYLADMEEWIYLFWARRVMDGKINQTEKVLRKLVSLM